LSPELPTFSAELADKHKLTFPVLNDHGLTIAKASGLVFTLPDDLKDVYLNVFKNDLAKRKREPSWQLPMPAEHDAGPIRPSQQQIASGAEPIRQSR
jgi:hypothetical protein